MYIDITNLSLSTLPVALLIISIGLAFIALYGKFPGDTDRLSRSRTIILILFAVILFLVAVLYPFPSINKQLPGYPTSTVPTNSLSKICKGEEPIIFNDRLPVTDPCRTNVADNIVPGMWVIVEPLMDSGWQTGKCLLDYSHENDLRIYEGSMWALFKTNSLDRNLPNCEKLD